LEASSRKRVLFLIAHEGFNDRELLDPKAVLEERGAEVILASTVRGECHGMGGTKVIANLAIDDVRPEEYDAIVLVGGSGAKLFLSENPKVHSLLRSFEKEGKLIAAIGRARHALFEVGLFGGNFSYGPKVEIRDNVIAARPPATTPGWTSKDFGRLLADRLFGPTRV
jgi:protease I